MAKTKLKIESREESKNPRQLRAAGNMPGSLYGKNMEAKSIQINTHEFEMAHRNNKDGEWELSLGKEKYNAKIQELQINYATNEYLNVEFTVI